jgi:enhancing lycopene biosynthesis protein 2
MMETEVVVAGQETSQAPMTHLVCCQEEAAPGRPAPALCGAPTVSNDLYTDQVECTVCRDMDHWAEMPCPRGGLCPK